MAVVAMAVPSCRYTCYGYTYYGAIASSLGGVVLQEHALLTTPRRCHLAGIYLLCRAGHALPTYYLPTYHHLLPFCSSAPYSLPSYLPPTYLLSRRSDRTPPRGQGRWARPHPRRSIPPPSRVKVRVTRLGIPPPSRRDLSYRTRPDQTVPSGFFYRA